MVYAGKVFEFGFEWDSVWKETGSVEFDFVGFSLGLLGCSVF